METFAGTAEGDRMNQINHKRLVNALEELKQVEENIVPCWAEEDHTLSLLCENETYCDEMIVKYEKVLVLEKVLDCIRQSSKLLRVLTCSDISVNT